MVGIKNDLTEIVTTKVAYNESQNRSDPSENMAARGFAYWGKELFKKNKKKLLVQQNTFSILKTFYYCFRSTRLVYTRYILINYFFPNYA